MNRDGVWTPFWMISSSKISKMERAKLCPRARVDVVFCYMDVAEKKNKQN